MKFSTVRKFIENLAISSVIIQLFALALIVLFIENTEAYIKIGRKSKLIKKVCKKCISKCQGRAWYQADEDDWRQGKIQCPHSKEYTKIKIQSGPPEDCPYTLEHLLK